MIERMINTMSCSSICEYAIIPDVHMFSKNAKSVFISDPKGRLGIGKLLLAAGRVNNRVALLVRR